MRGSRQYEGGAESRTRRISWHKWQGAAAAKRLNSQYFGRPVRAEEAAAEEATAEELAEAEGRTRFLLKSEVGWLEVAWSYSRKGGGDDVEGCRCDFG